MPTARNVSKHEMFASLLQQFMDEGLCSDARRVPQQGHWDEPTLAEELVKISQNRDREGYLETVKRNIRGWLSRSKSCHQKWFVLLCRLFFGAANDSRKRDFIKAHRASRARSDLTDRLEFGQVGDKDTLRLVYKFDEAGYVVKEGEIVEDIPWVLFEGWYDAYTPGFFCAFDNGSPIAVFGLFPITKQFYDDLTAGKVSEFKLAPEIIRAACRPGEPRLWWYLSGVSWKGKRRGVLPYFPRLVAKALCQFIRNNVDPIGFRKFDVVSEGATPRGEGLLNKRFGFQVITTEVPTKKPRFKSTMSIEYIMYLLSHEDFFMGDPVIQNAADAIRAHVNTIVGEPSQAAD